MNGICAENTVLHSMKICLHGFSPTLSSGSGVCHSTSGYLLTFGLWWGFSPARLLKRKKDITKLIRLLQERIRNVIFQAHRPGESR